MSSMCFLRRRASTLASSSPSTRVTASACAGAASTVAVWFTFILLPGGGLCFLDLDALGAGRVAGLAEDGPEAEVPVSAQHVQRLEGTGHDGLAALPAVELIGLPRVINDGLAHLDGW